MNNPFEEPSGLTSAEAARRLVVYGRNVLPSAGSRNLIVLLSEALKEPLLFLILAAGALSLAVGDAIESILLATLGLLNVGLVVYQEYKTERVLESLRDLASPRALVIRDGQRRRIAGADVVPGDFLLLAEGDRVAADGRVHSCIELAADESLLTGESVPVQKSASGDTTMKAERPGGDNQPFVFSGSLVVKGRGIIEVTSTGSATEMGRIGKSLGEIRLEPTRLRRSTNRLTRNITILAALISVSVIVLYGLRYGDWIGAAMAGITIAVSVLPEEIPVVLTVFLTLGAWRIARHNVLTRRPAMIETLGATTILCTDKTGTLTQNRMAVVKAFHHGCEVDIRRDAEIPPPEKALIDAAILACAPHSADPMEQAILRLPHALPPEDVPIHEYGLTRELLAVTAVWPGRNLGSYIVAAKGAPEAIVELCRIGSDQRAALLRAATTMAQNGLRVLGVARAEHEGALPKTPAAFAFNFLGFVGLADPLRDTVPAAVAECRRAGIRVVMITGDYPETAIAIAKAAGIATEGGAISGKEIGAMAMADLAPRLKTVNVFARIMPEQKLWLVQALKDHGDVVAMTGDGVNDAPALKAAHIGIAMGGRGTDVAREAASLVLLDDAFESIVAAIRLGRRIYNNLRKALSYILAIHVPIAGLALFPLLAGWPTVFTVLHIVFIELIIDPICALAFEAEQENRNIMERAPRSPDLPLFGTHEIVFALLQGTLALVAILVAYGWALKSGVAENEARGVAFASLIAANLALIFANRSWTRTAIETMRRPNPTLWWIIGAALILLGLIFYMPLFAGIFDVAAPSTLSFAFIAAVALSTIFGADGLKYLRNVTAPR
jgi:Ca2+-transporting ATPase